MKTDTNLLIIQTTMENFLCFWRPTRRRFIVRGFDLHLCLLLFKFVFGMLWVSVSTMFYQWVWLWLPAVSCGLWKFQVQLCILQVHNVSFLLRFSHFSSVLLNCFELCILVMLWSSTWILIEIWFKKYNMHYLFCFFWNMHYLFLREKMVGDEIELQNKRNRLALIYICI